MNQNELEIGDIVFYSSPFLGVIEHTSIYLGTMNNVPYVIHATRTPHKSLMVTHLNHSEDFNYHVVRPTYVDLAVDAIVILLRWVEHQVPYATEQKTSRLFSRAEELFSMELKSSEKKQAIFGKEHYKSNYSQYITMANTLPYIPTENGIIEGFGCAESVVSAFNIALFISHATPTVSAGINKWSIDHSNLEEFIDQIDSPFPFDAKSALSGGLFEHCVSNPAHWTNLGALQVQESQTANEEDKEMWREFKESLKARAHILVNKLSASSPSKALQKLYTQCNSTSRPRSHSVNYIDVIAFAESNLDTDDTEDDASIDSLELNTRPRLVQEVSTLAITVRSFSFSSIKKSPLMMFFSPAKQPKPYLPMQKLENISPSKSSDVNAPVTSHNA